MNIAVVGSRSFDDYPRLCHLLDSLKPRPFTIVSGGAKGADSLAARYARERSIELIVFEADWDRHGKRAGLIRNAEIVAHADALIAFWDGESRGTAHSIALARARGIPVFVVRFRQPMASGDSIG